MFKLRANLTPRRNGAAVRPADEAPMPAPKHPARETAEPVSRGRQERPEAAESQAENEERRRAIEALLALHALPARLEPVAREAILAWRHAGDKY